MAFSFGFAIAIGIIGYAIITAFSITGVGLPFGDYEKDIWVDTVYWGILLPLLFYMIAHVIHFFFLKAKCHAPTERSIGITVTACIFWVLAGLSCLYSIIVFGIAATGCSGNLQCDRQQNCNASGTLPGVTAGARARFIALFVEVGVCFIVAVIHFFIVLLSMWGLASHSAASAVGAKKTSSNKGVKFT